MGWADAVEAVIEMGPRKLVRRALLALVLYMALTGDATPVVLWIEARTTSAQEHWLPLLTGTATP
ncbi:hypothetical protein [Actinotalea sp. JY-7885]|uniref:hypothetical protein n=1 Tax=Actinotalea sp. JY-7885 TaxID=2758576 RepID=UPI00165E4696|nr:hypothetical protein [Actinotalea sp. JY-7885]